MIAAGAAANDASSRGLDEARFRRDGELVIDRRRAEQAVIESLAARGMLDDLSGPPEVSVTRPQTVSVRLTRRVDYVFAKALPGERSADVSASATAVAAAR